MLVDHYGGRYVADQRADSSVRTLMERKRGLSGVVVTSEKFHHALKPLVNGADLFGELLTPIATNSLGFRDRTPRIVPTATTSRRLLFMGDSFTMGQGVPFEVSFVGRVDSKLRTSGFEVLNAAVSSYAPIIHEAKLRELIDDVHLKIDAVAIFLDISDAEDEAVFYRENSEGQIKTSCSRYDTYISHRKWERQNLRRVRERLKAGSIGEDEVKMWMTSRMSRDCFIRSADAIDSMPPSIALLDFIEMNSLVGQLYAIYQRDILHIPDNGDYARSAWTWDSNYWREYGEEGILKMTEHMNRIAEVAEGNGIRLIIAVYPWPEQIRHREARSPQVQHWKEWAVEHHAEMIDYFPVFITEEDPEQTVRRLYIPGDVHWNAEGHRVVADRFLISFER
jgi:hypothetical protein